MAIAQVLIAVEKHTTVELKIENLICKYSFEHLGLRNLVLYGLKSNSHNFFSLRLLYIFTNFLSTLLFPN